MRLLRCCCSFRCCFLASTRANITSVGFCLSNSITSIHIYDNDIIVCTSCGQHDRYTMQFKCVCFILFYFISFNFSSAMEGVRRARFRGGEKKIRMSLNGSHYMFVGLNLRGHCAQAFDRIRSANQHRSGESD